MIYEVRFERSGLISLPPALLKDGEEVGMLSVPFQRTFFISDEIFFGLDTFLPEEDGEMLD